MADLGTYVLLFHLLTSHIDAWENLPPIPANRRAEYYLLHDDGAYKFGYDTGRGQHAQVNADAKNEVNGQYSYVDNNGQRTSLSYTAGEKGFVPKLDTITQSAHSSSTGTSKDIKTKYSAVVIPQSHGNEYNNFDNTKSDASYSFTIDSDSYKRTETSDPDGNIHGQYSYNSPIGGSHHISYIAGAETGFVVTNKGENVGHLGSGPSGSPFTVSNGLKTTSSSTSTLDKNDGSYSFSYSTGDQSREESSDSENNVRGRYSFVTPDDKRTHHIEYQSGAITGYVAQGDDIPKSVSSISSQSKDLQSSSIISTLPRIDKPTSQVSSYTATNNNGINSDGSYSFSFDTGEQTREESGDAQNNVRGSYSFVSPDDKRTHHIEYQSGALTGYVAQGDDIPKSVSSISSQSKDLQSSSIISTLPRIDKPTSQVSSYTATNNNGINSDGSYSFSFDTGEQTREESGDAQNNVRGSYSYLLENGGKIHRIDYIAGSDTGFIAKSNASPSGSGNSVNNKYTNNISTKSQGFISSLEESVPSSDGSYSFSYSTTDHSRIEEGDSQGNIRGSFSFISKDDNQLRKVDYEAGAEKGFIAKGAHLPEPAAGASALSNPSPTNLNQPYSIPSESFETSRNRNDLGTDDDNSDASYSYSYKTDSSSKEESSDSAGNVVGSFTFIGGDGISRNVQYTSRGEEGFIAVGQHLPKNVAPVSHSTKLNTQPREPSILQPQISYKDITGKSASSFKINTYLPPQSLNKFGYIFDSEN